MQSSYYLNSLPQSTPAADRQWQADFYASMPIALQKLVDEAAAIETASDDTILRSIGLIDHTSLKAAAPMTGSESAADIERLCREAIGFSRLSTAAVCFYPNQIPVALPYLDGYDVALAVVNNFPHGDQNAAQAAADAFDAVAAGADEIDTVIDYEAWIKGDIDTVREKLEAVNASCERSGAPLKTILKASVHKDYRSLYDAAQLACATGADYVKTCTGMAPKPGFGTGTADASNLLTMVTTMHAVAEYNRTHNIRIGVKISGGIKTPIDCERLRFLSDCIFGRDYFNSYHIRIGASSLRANLVLPQPATCSPAPGGY